MTVFVNDDPFDTRPGTLSTQVPILVSLATRTLAKQPRTEAWHLISPLLNHANEKIREAALMYVVTVLAESELKALLEQTVEQSRYYYNVACW